MTESSAERPDVPRVARANSPIIHAACRKSDAYAMCGTHLGGKPWWTLHTGWTITCKRCRRSLGLRHL